MSWLYFLCAVVGGTILLCQLVVTLMGLGGHGDVSHDLSDPGDVHDVHGPHDLHDAAHDHAGDSAEHAHGAAGHGNWSTWIFGIISFRTVVAALTFFGMVGMASTEGGLPPLASLAVAIAAGYASMLGVHSLMRLLMRLRSDGTMRIERTLGARGNVYVPIPANGSGWGKVQLRLTDRIVELKARTTAGERLATGSLIVVTEIAGHDSVVVAPVTPRPRTLTAESPENVRS